MVKPIVYDTVTRDLCRHASDKATKAVLDTMALADSPEQRVAIALHVMGSIGGLASGAYSTWQGMDVRIDTHEFVGLLLTAAREEALKAKAAGL